MNAARLGPSSVDILVSAVSMMSVTRKASASYEAMLIILVHVVPSRPRGEGGKGVGAPWGSFPPFSEAKLRQTPSSPLSQTRDAPSVPIQKLLQTGPDREKMNVDESPSRENFLNPTFVYRY